MRPDIASYTFGVTSETCVFSIKYARVFTDSKKTMKYL